MTVTPADLRSIPLFQNITDEHVTALLAAFEPVAFSAGAVLFEAGSHPEHLLLLAEGEVALKEGDDVKFRLRPPQPIGELGAVTGLLRNTRAEAVTDVRVLRIGTDALMAFFEKNGDVAFPFHHNLLRIVADKVRREASLLEVMRSNIIRTQKAMKKLRDLVLETEETPLSKDVFETLEDLIAHNRRWNYRVEPRYTLATSVRFDDGEIVPVSEMSASWLVLGAKAKSAPAVGDHWSGVLVLPSGELPVSGTVRPTKNAGLLVELDLLIDTYRVAIEEHLTRVQLLDFVV
jgi:CRP-like cAMP-binding protein